MLIFENELKYTFYIRLFIFCSIADCGPVRVRWMRKLSFLKNEKRSRRRSGLHECQLRWVRILCQNNAANNCNVKFNVLEITKYENIN